MRSSGIWLAFAQRSFMSIIGPIVSLVAHSDGKMDSMKWKEELSRRRLE